MFEYRMVEAFGMAGWIDSDPFRYPIEDVSTKTVSYQAFSLPIGQHIIKGLRHPDITEDTAKRYIADLVVSAWAKR